MKLYGSMIKQNAYARCESCGSAVQSSTDQYKVEADDGVYVSSVRLVYACGLAFTIVETTTEPIDIVSCPAPNDVKSAYQQLVVSKQKRYTDDDQWERCHYCSEMITGNKDVMQVIIDRKHNTQYFDRFCNSICQRQWRQWNRS